jgi:hypothetical protein
MKSKYHYYNTLKIVNIQKTIFLFLESIFLICLLTMNGCNENKQTKTVTKSDDKPRSTEGRMSDNGYIIPNDIKCVIVDSSIIPGIKRGLDVRLNKKISEADLRSIALKIKSLDSRSYERTLIGYYLPEMEIGKGAWATTHFNPDLEIKILGLTIEQEEKLRQTSTSDTRDIIGRWLDESPLVGASITIFREDGNLFLETIYMDNSKGKVEIIEKKTSQGRKFVDKEGSDYGEHWLLISNGNLQIRDNEGLIATAVKIQ